MPGIAPSSISRRNRRQSRSSCAPVAASAISTSRASFVAVATRVSARTFAYDRRPLAIAAIDRRKPPERPRDAHLLARRARHQPDPPRQPVRAAPRALAPPFLGFIKSPDAGQQTMRSNVDLRRQQRDFIGQANAPLRASLRSCANYTNVQYVPQGKDRREWREIEGMTGAMSEIGRATRDRICALFSAADDAEAERMIATFVRDVIPGGSPRIEFAAVRYSAGDLACLREAIELGQIDWRDLLVAAEFADDLHAHERWLPRRLDTQIVNLWMSGRLPQGVRFRSERRRPARRRADAR